MFTILSLCDIFKIGQATPYILALFYIIHSNLLFYYPNFYFQLAFQMSLRAVFAHIRIFSFALKLYFSEEPFVRIFLANFSVYSNSCHWVYCNKSYITFINFSRLFFYFQFNYSPALRCYLGIGILVIFLS